MQYTKPMIELVMQIRKWVPSELKPDVKLANPNLFNVLAIYYHDNPKIITQALIKELFTLAGGEWIQSLSEPQHPQTQSTVKVYRGQTSLVEKTEPLNAPPPSAPKKSTRFYRGVAIND